jgi:hypothetical protein
MDQLMLEEGAFEVGVQRNLDRADPREREEQLEHLDTVRAQYRHSVTASNAKSHEAGSNGLGPLLHLGEGELTLLSTAEPRAGSSRRPTLEQPGNGPLVSQG